LNRQTESGILLDINPVEKAMAESGFEITEIVSGGAPGPDTAAVYIAQKGGIPYRVFHAQWNQHRRAAGIIRNRQMAEYADALIAVWDGESRGTKNMIETMKKMGKPVFVKIISGRESDGGTAVEDSGAEP